MINQNEKKKKQVLETHLYQYVSLERPRYLHLIDTNKGFVILFCALKLIMKCYCENQPSKLFSV